MKRKARPSKLLGWQVEDAARLKKLIEAEQAKPDWPGLDAFAARAIQKSGSYLSQLANGYRPIPLEYAGRLAHALGVAHEDLSPTMARSVVEILHFAGHGEYQPSRVEDSARTPTPDELAFARDWAELAEPARSQIRQQVELLLAAQKIQQAARKRKDRN